MIKRLFLVLTACLACLGALTDCKDACGPAMPVISTVQALISDGEMAVDQAEAAFNAMNLPIDVKNTALGYIYQARTVLRSADTTLKSIASACQAPDALSLLKDLLPIWTLIEGLLGQNSAKLGYAPGAVVVAAPQIVVELRQRGVTP